MYWNLSNDITCSAPIHYAYFQGFINECDILGDKFTL